LNLKLKHMGEPAEEEDMHTPTIPRGESARETVAQAGA
jgi:hypothetical protein